MAEAFKRQALNGKPEALRNAIVEGDHLKVQAFAKAGGKAAAEKKARDRMDKEVLDAKRGDEDFVRKQEANEHEYPPEIY